MSIIVKTQEELEKIPQDCMESIIICGVERIMISDKYYCPVVVQGNSSVIACRNSSVQAWDNSSVQAWDNSSVEARDNSFVVAYGNSVVEAYGNSSVYARDNSSVRAYRNSSVQVRENSFVEARDHSSVEAWENSSVEAHENSSVEAWGNSSVEAHENSSVEAWGNTQVVQTGDQVINIYGNARIVHKPCDIESYCDFYGIKTCKGLGRFYKAVHRSGENYYSDFDRNFVYKVGEIAVANGFDDNQYDVCSGGIHVSHSLFALQYGQTWSDLAILEVEARLEDIVVPPDSAKIRCPQVKVRREVPLEELGVYGKIIAKRRERLWKNVENTL